MARKPKKGYFVNGHFVTLGSDLDRELKAELKGTSDKSRTDMKKDSDHRQAVGEALMDLRPKLLKGLDLPERLMQSLAEAKKLTDFGAKRRQLQHVGKMMRQLDEATVMACEAALQAQHQGSPQEAAEVRAAEHWRDQLMADDAALTHWMASHPETDIQALRSLVRQARKDAEKALSTQPTPAPEPADGERVRLPKAGKAYKELFQMLREALRAPAADADDTDDGEDDE